jgi:hypothetical protein
MDASNAIDACRNSIYTKAGKGCGSLNEVIVLQIG